jgi:hypothetical protein
MPTKGGPVYTAGEQCHAKKTGNNQRCSRAAKGTTGFCWQHQQSPDGFPNN